MPSSFTNRFLLWRNPKIAIELAGAISVKTIGYDFATPKNACMFTGTIIGVGGETEAPFQVCRFTAVACHRKRHRLLVKIDYCEPSATAVPSVASASINSFIFILFPVFSTLSRQLTLASGSFLKFYSSPTYWGMLYLIKARLIQP